MIPELPNREESAVAVADAPSGIPDLTLRQDDIVSQQGYMVTQAAGMADAAFQAAPGDPNAQQSIGLRRSQRDSLRQLLEQSGGAEYAAQNPQVVRIAHELLSGNQQGREAINQAQVGRVQQGGATGAFVENLGRGLYQMADPFIRAGSAVAGELTGDHAGAVQRNEIQDMATQEAALAGGAHPAAGLAGMGAGTVADMFGGPGALLGSATNRVTAPLLNKAFGEAKTSALRALFNRDPAMKVLTENLPDNALRGAINFVAMQSVPRALNGQGYGPDEMLHDALMGALFHSAGQHSTEKLRGESPSAAYSPVEMGEPLKINTAETTAATKAKLEAQRDALIEQRKATEAQRIQEAQAHQQQIAELDKQIGDVKGSGERPTHGEVTGEMLKVKAEFDALGEKEKAARLESEARPKAEPAPDEVKAQMLAKAEKQLAEMKPTDTAPQEQPAFSDLESADAYGRKLAVEHGLEFKGVQDNEGLAPNSLTFQIPGEKGGGFNLAEGENFVEKLSAKRESLKGASDASQIKGPAKVGEQPGRQEGVGGVGGKALEPSQQGPGSAGAFEEIKKPEKIEQGLEPQKGAQLDEAVKPAHTMESLRSKKHADVRAIAKGMGVEATGTKEVISKRIIQKQSATTIDAFKAKLPSMKWYELEAEVKRLDEAGHGEAGSAQGRSTYAGSEMYQAAKEELTRKLDEQQARATEIGIGDVVGNREEPTGPSRAPGFKTAADQPAKVISPAKEFDPNDIEGSKTRGLGADVQAIAKRAELPTQYDTLKKPGMKKSGISKLKDFLKAVPEFEIDPAFTVTEDGRLKFQDGGKYIFEPEAIGLVPEKWKAGERVRIDPEAIKKAKATDSLIAVAKAEKEGAVPADPEGEGPVATPSNQLQQPRNMVGTTQPEITAREIVNQMQEMTGTPFRVGHGSFGQRKTRGWFNRKTDVVRQKIANELSTAVHEFGHAMHEKIIGWQTAWPAGVAGELELAGKQLYGTRKPNGGYRREGLAEYVARFMLDDNLSMMPKTKDWIENTVLPAHPEFAKQWATLKSQFETWNDQGAAARVAAQIQKVDRSPLSGLKKGYEFLTAQLWKKYRTAMTTDQAGLEDLIKQVEMDRGTALPFRQNPAKVRQALKSSYAGTARAFIMDAAMGRDFQPIGPSLVDTLKPIKANLDDFIVYAVARRGLDLHERGINPGFTKADAQHTVDLLKSQKFSDALDAVTGWSNNLIDYLVDAGGLSREAADAMRELNPVYLPFKRYFDEAQLGGNPGAGRRGIANQGQMIKRIKGSGREIIDPLDSLAAYAEQTIKHANKLDVARAIIELAEKNKRMAYLAEKVETPKEHTSFRLEEITKQLDALGVDTAKANLDEMLWIFDNATQYHGKDNIVTLWRNGKREFWELHPDLFKVVTEMDKDQPGDLLRTLAKFKRGVQLGATGLNPRFSFITNPLRDMLTHYISSKTKEPGRLFYGWFDGLRREIMKDEYAQLWRRAGGEMTTIMGQDRAAAGRLVEEGLAETKGEKAVMTLKHPVDALRQFFGMMESAPRISEFYTVLKDRAKSNGGHLSRDAVLEALLASKDVTVDFTRAGIQGQALNMMVPFFNASLQGSAKILRMFSGAEGLPRAVQVWGRAMPVAIGSALLWWAAKDQEWYKKREEWEKDQYWLMSPDGGKHVLRIPKGDLGFAFGTIITRALQSIHEKDPAAVDGALLDGLAKFSPLRAPLDAVYSMAKPAVEVQSNYDSFRGRAIDTEADLGKLAKDRYSKWTTETAKALGSMLGVSPKRIEHLMAGYTGGLGLEMARMTEWVAGARKVKGEASDIPVVGTMFSREPTGGGAYAAKLYERLNLLEQKKGSRALPQSEFAEYKRLEAVAKALGAMRKQRDAMEADGKDTAAIEANMMELAKRTVESK